MIDASGIIKRVVAAKSNQLQIDLDGADELRLHGFFYKLLQREGLTKGWRTRISNSSKRGHVHITITLPKSRPVYERIALQALLGSDRGRECFNWIRYKRRAKFPIIFFEEYCVTEKRPAKT